MPSGTETLLGRVWWHALVDIDAGDAAVLLCGTRGIL